MGKRLIQLINICLEKNIPFVSFRLPDEAVIKTWIQLSGQFTLVEHIQEVADQSGFVYAPFHRKTNFPVVFFNPELIIENEGFEDLLIKEISKKDALYPEYNLKAPIEIGKKEYLEQAKKIIQTFDNEFPKTVLSRIQFENRSEHFDAGKYFIKLQENYPDAFCHIINIPGAGVWTGASPEALLKIEGNNAQTISLAGTQPFHEGDIKWSEKDLEEQQIVTDYIENLFKKFNIQNFQKQEIRNKRAGNVMHLETKFSFDKFVINNQLGSFISELHPTPAVCGLPKEKALELILQTEKHNREYYVGFCGTTNMDEKTELFVNLRCMKVLKDQLALFLGGGLTAKSNPHKEWKETILKAETLLSIL